MRLTPTPEQQELCDAVARFCTEQITPERLTAWRGLVRPPAVDPAAASTTSPRPARTDVLAL